MQVRLDGILTRFRTQSQQSYEIWAPYSKYYALSSIFVVSAALYDSAVLDSCYNTWPIRTAMAIALLLSYFFEFLPTRLQRYQAVLWITGITFVIPFSFGLMMVEAAACTMPGETVDEFLVLQYVAALFLLIQVCGNLLLVMFCWITASALIAATLLASSDVTNWAEVSRVCLQNLGVYTTVILVGSLAVRTNQLFEKSRSDVGFMIGSNIAHELRTPLSSIRSFARSAKRFITSEPTASFHPVSKDISSRAEQALELIETEVQYSNTLIDLLLMNTSFRSVDDYANDRFSVQACVFEAVERFPFQSRRERSLVTIDCRGDFQVVAPQLLMTHVVFNLLKNAVYYCQKSRSPSVEIVIDANTASVSVIDNGPGISDRDMRYIFNRYFTSTRAGEGAGVGLSFCKSVVDGVGGTIECLKSERGHTEFRLTLRKATPSLVSKADQ